KDVFLRISGYNEFPVLVPRWSVRGGDVYGRGPGWNVFRDCRALQHLEEKLARLFDLAGEPPMKGSEDIEDASIDPGSFTRIPRGAQAMYEPVLRQSDTAQAIDKVERHIERHEKRI